MNGESAFAKLVDSGILGALLVLALIALAFMYKEVRRVDKEKNDERDARLKDIKDMQILDRNIVSEVKTTMQNLYELLTHKSNG